VRAASLPATTDDTPTSPSLGLVDRLQPVLLVGSIALGLGLAKGAPQVADKTSPLVSGGVLLLIYLVMLRVGVDGISKAFTQRRFLAIAVFLNFVINPMLAWALGSVLLGGHPDLRIGLILFLVTPCIGWYLLFSELAGGDAALGVSLLGVNIGLQVLLLPVYLYLFSAGGDAATVDLAAVTGSVAKFLVLPAAAAAVTRLGATRTNLDLQSLQGRVDAAHLKTVTLVVIIVSMFASQADVVFDNPTVMLRLLAPMVAFFVIAFTIALVSGRFAGLSYDQTALLVFTTTSRNSEASLAIAATAFASPLVGLTVVLGPVIELPLLVLMVRVLRARQPKFETSRQKDRTPT